jgi:hypothetical protein
MAGGEAGHQALKAAGGPVDAGPERDDEGGETRLVQETPRDQGGEDGEDEADPTGEVGGEGLDRDRGGGKGTMPHRAVRCGGGQGRRAGIGRCDGRDTGGGGHSAMRDGDGDGEQ